MFKSFYIIVVIAVSLTISSCVTTTNGRTNNVVDKDKAHDAHVSLGLTYLKQDNREGSRRHLQKALGIRSDSAPAHHGLALLYQRTGEFKLAEQSFLRSLSEEPDFTQARVSYGRFLYQQKRYDEAYKAFEAASTDISFQNRALALTYLGQTALKLGNDVKAKSLFEHAANLDNKLTLPMIELGDLYFLDKNYTQSKKYLDQYIDIEGRTPRGLWLGCLLYTSPSPRDRG